MNILDKINKDRFDDFVKNNTAISHKINQIDYSKIIKSLKNKNMYKHININIKDVIKSIK